MLQDKLNQISTLVQEAASELPTELAQAKAQGDAEGYARRAQEEGGGDAIYTQAQLDAKLAEQAATYETQVSELQAQVSAFPEQIEAAKTEAVAAKLAELKAAYEASQVVETQGETGFGSLLG